MARWVQVFKKTLSQLSEMVNYAMGAQPTETSVLVEADADFKTRVDMIISHWAQKRRSVISSIYKEGGHRYIDLSGDEGKKCQITIDPIDPRTKEFGLNVSDTRSRRKEYIASIEDLNHKLDEAFGVAQRWMNE